MVKIRLRRTGSKHRPFYRVVVAKSTSGRDGSFIEIIGTYNPVTKPKHINIKEDRALHWLLSGAQPSETAAIIMSRVGILDKFFEQRPAAKKQYRFLDKRTAAMSVQSVVAPVAVEKPAPAPAPVAETPVEETPAEAAMEEVAADTAVEVEAVVQEEPAPVEAVEAVEAVAAEDAPAEPAAEEPAPAEAPAEETKGE